MIHAISWLDCDFLNRNESLLPRSTLDYYNLNENSRIDDRYVYLAVVADWLPQDCLMFNFPQNSTLLTRILFR